MILLGVILIVVKTVVRLFRGMDVLAVRSL